jgi:hypothetical protein
MSKKGRSDRNEKAANLLGRKTSMIWKITVVLLGVSLVVALFLFFPMGEPWGLPAVPHNPRPATLSPALFTGEAARAYQIAQEAPELLERMPCYCGCYVNAGHRNNLDCYTDRHGAG